MDNVQPPMTRRQFLKAAGVTVAGVSIFGLAGCGQAKQSSSGASAQMSPVTLSWLTWDDHFMPEQLKAIKQQTGISARPSLFDDNIEAYVKLKQRSVQWDIASGDALWVPKYSHEGLIDSFDMAELPVSSQLYSVARDIPFWKDGTNTMAYPFGWSSLQIYYNPKYVTTKPDSWHALIDPKYKAKVVAENQPTDLMAMAGIATGAKQPYNMTPDEISGAKAFLTQLKPNILKLVSEDTQVVRALADESAWLAIENLGTDERVKDAGGPGIEVATPQEGVYGWMDSEMLAAASPNKDRFRDFLDAFEQAEWIAKNFISFGRPLFNEKAYTILVNQGQKERADRLLYNQPERPLSMVLKGPSSNAQAYVDAFNEVFGA
jgi:spermidine/putrescine-binding protein